MTRRLSRHVPDALMIAGGLVVPTGVAYFHLGAAIIVAGIELLLAGLLLTLGGNHGSAR